MSALTTRNAAKKELFGETFKELYEFTPTASLPAGHIVIGRMLALCKTAKGIKSYSRAEASKIVANELRRDWITKNVYPMKEHAVANKIQKDYERFNSLRKYENSKKTKTEKWCVSAEHFKDSLIKNAYDIRCKDVSFQKQMEEDFGVKMTQEDLDFYQDNCFGSYKLMCTNTVPKDWERMKKRKQSREASVQKKRFKQCEDEKEQKEINRNELLNSVIDESIDSENLNFHTKRRLFTEPAKTSSTKNTFEQNSEDCLTFPKVKIRNTFKRLNESVIRCLVQCQSETTCSTMEVCKIMVNVANMIFHQDWEMPEIKDKDESTENDKDGETDSSSEEDEKQEGGICEREPYEKKKRKCKKDLTFTLPSRRTIMRYLEDASYMSLRYVAHQLLNNEESVVTVGLDDTTKAAGHKTYDIKTDHITMKVKSQPKKILTTGYIENLSHSGDDGAAAYNHKLKCLSILADCSVEDLKSHIDFWMSDRGSDLDVLLENLGVEEEKRLKCCAHIILCIDNAIDKVFKNTEQMVGVQKILQLSAGEEIFKSPGSSIHTLGLIAIAKLLSPSHASHTVSLYNDYKLWLESNNNELCNNFKGFVSNRFGRIAELAKIFISHHDYIKAFFEVVVDVNSNKLVLAVSTFIQNEWFTACARLYVKVGELIIFPLMDFLGIDKKGEKNLERSWSSAKTFFDQKLFLLKDMHCTIEETNPNGIEKLEAACLREVIESVERQISMVPFFRNEENSNVDTIKLGSAPLTNLGCESEFSKFDHRVKVTGGSTSIQTHSKKNIVVTNGLLIDSSFKDLPEREKRLEWSWARCSKETTEVRKLEKDFVETVKATKKIALIKKEKLKLEKTRKTFNTLEQCKKHGGPITPGCIELLEQLNNMQLLLEIGYLRLTTSPNIRQMRRVKQNDKFIMQKFTDNELRTSIRNSIAPVNEISEDVESLLNAVL